MSDYVVETNVHGNKYDPYFILSWIAILGTFLYCVFQRKPNSEILSEIKSTNPASTVKVTKPECDIKVHEEKKVENQAKPNNQTNNEALLHAFNIKIKEEFAKNPINPFQIVEDMKSMNLIPDITTFNTLLDTCLEQKKISLAFQFFSFMKSRHTTVKLEDSQANNYVDIVSYNTILKGISLQVNDRNSMEVNQELISQTLSLFQELKDLSFIPTQITYNTVIEIFVRASEMHLAFKFYDEMRDNGLQPDNFTFSTLIKGIKNHHNANQRESPSKPRRSRGEHSDLFTLDKVLELFECCKQQPQFKPDEILYNCVIDACVKFNNLSKALEVYEEMKKLGVLPTSVTYGILIKGYAQEKKFGNVMEIIDLLTSQGIKMNEQLYSSLIDACLKCDKSEKAIEFYKQMERDPELKISAPLYSMLIKGLTNNRQFDKAYEIFLMMNRNINIVPNIINYNATLECAIKANSTKFFDIYNEILKKSDVMQPDLVTYSTYIKGLCKFNRVTDAFVMYDKLKKEKTFELDEVLFNSLLHGLQKVREYDKALLVYKDMLDNNIKPSNVTYSILIKIYSDRYDFENALELFNKVRIESNPGVILYTCIIQACVRCKKINKLLEFYEEMKQFNIYCKFPLLLFNISR